MNPYLKRKRDEYDTLRASIDEIQTRAVTEDRDLTEDELRSITEMSGQAEPLVTQITNLTDIEVRTARVAELAASLPTDASPDGDSGNEATRLTGTTTTQARDPGYYTRSSEFSFFQDLYRSRENGDRAASDRLTEHNRALSTQSQGPGIVPPHWLTEEFELIARQGRALASAVRNIPLGDDPRPLTLPKQTAGTDSVVQEQAAENQAVSGADAWDSDVDIVTPKPTAGKQTVSRQMIDMSTPAIDQLIYEDLLAVYNRKVEDKVGAALIAAAGAPVVTFATEAAFNAAGAAHNSVIDLGIEVWDARKLPADILAMPTRRWGKFKKLKDTDGRPLIPTSTAGPMNVIGVGSVRVAGEIENLGVMVSDGLGNGLTYPESYLAFRAADQILFESNVLRFRFEEVSGPESIVLGIWAYSAFISRQAGKSVKRVQVTAAS